MRKSVFILLVVVFISSNCYSGAWTRELGGSYQQLSFTYLQYRGLFNQELGNRKIKREISDYTLQYYVEYGFRERLTLIGVLPFKMESAGSDLIDIDPKDDINTLDTAEAGNLYGFSNISIGVKYLLHKERHVWSTQLNMGTATTSFDRETGLRTGFDCWLVTGSLLHGIGFNSSYLTSEIGYQFKSNKYSDNFIFNFEYGKKFLVPSINSKIWLAFVVNAVVPVTNENYNDGRSIHTGLYQNNAGYASPGIKYAHFLNDHLSFNLSGYGAFWADLNGTAGTYTFGFAYTL